jgi:hypothetical protein
MYVRLHSIRISKHRDFLDRKLGVSRRYRNEPLVAEVPLEGR